MNDEKFLVKGIGNPDNEIVQSRQSVWQTIETAPKDGTVIDLWVNDSNQERIADAHFDNDKQCFVIWDDWHDSEWVELERNITHWMPLPQPPSQ